jgi:hypothetical protein
MPLRMWTEIDTEHQGIKQDYLTRFSFDFGLLKHHLDELDEETQHVIHRVKTYLQTVRRAKRDLKHTLDRLVVDRRGMPGMHQTLRLIEQLSDRNHQSYHRPSALRLACGATQLLSYMHREVDGDAINHGFCMLNRGKNDFLSHLTGCFQQAPAAAINSV